MMARCGTWSWLPLNTGKFRIQGDDDCLEEVNSTTLSSALLILQNKKKVPAFEQRCVRRWKLLSSANEKTRYCLSLLACKTKALTLQSARKSSFRYFDVTRAFASPFYIKINTMLVRSRLERNDLDISTSFKLGFTKKRIGQYIDITFSWRISAS